MKTLTYVNAWVWAEKLLTLSVRNSLSRKMSASAKIDTHKHIAKYRRQIKKLEGKVTKRLQEQEEELENVMGLLDMLYHLRCVDDTITHEDNMRLWTEVEKAVRGENK